MDYLHYITNSNLIFGVGNLTSVSSLIIIGTASVSIYCHCTVTFQLIAVCFGLQSGSHSTLQSVSNPYECCLGGRTIVGTSGQTVNNVRACSQQCDAIDILDSLCRWGHLAPTAPDTLGE